MRTARQVVRPLGCHRHGSGLARRASVSLGSVRWLPDGSYLALIYRPGLSAERRRRLAQTVQDGGEVAADTAPGSAGPPPGARERCPLGAPPPEAPEFSDLLGVDLVTAANELRS
jgi:CTP:molybdopterin cytidylyltransferase MocA